MLKHYDFDLSLITKSAASSVEAVYMLSDAVDCLNDVLSDERGSYVASMRVFELHEEVDGLVSLSIGLAVVRDDVDCIESKIVAAFSDDFTASIKYKLAACS